MDEITKGTQIHACLPPLIKILGIAIITELTSDICIDAGESSIASKVSLFAKTEILLLTLPLIKELFSVCQELIK
jgi:stage III sporulation protein AD